MKKFFTFVMMIGFVIVSCQKESSDLVSDDSYSNEVGFSASDPVIEYYASLGLTVYEAPSDYVPNADDFEYESVYLIEEQEVTADTIPGYGEIYVLRDGHDESQIIGFGQCFITIEGSNSTTYYCVYSKNCRNCRWGTGADGRKLIEVLE